MEPYLVANKYRIGRLIGARSNTDFFLGIDTDSNEEVLIKRVNANSKRPLLRIEYKIIEILTHRNAVGIPNIRAFRVEGDYNFLVTSMLGPSLEELLNFCNKKFTLKTVLMLAFQMIDHIEFIHDHSFLHRDINPDNFLMGLGNDENRVYASGFGLCKSYRDRNFSHIRFRGYRKSLIGSDIYASINTLSRIEPSRRDDLESLGYVLLYFLKGSLPWQGMKAKNMRERHKKICEMKVSIEALCEGYPPEFSSYFRYCRSLPFDEKPDYLHLKRIFRGLFVREGFQLDYAFDWKIKQSQMAAPKDGGDAGVVCSSEGEGSKGVSTGAVEHSSLCEKFHKTLLLLCNCVNVKD